MRKYHIHFAVLLVAFILSCTVNIHAATWDPESNGITPPATGNWSESANWSDSNVPGISTKVQFSNAAAECIVDAAATCNQLVIGDNGPDANNTLRIANGGSLIVVQSGNNWSTVGYNRSATLIVEEGGYFETGFRLGVGWFDQGLSYLTLNGGHVFIGGQGNLQVGDNSHPNHGGIVTVNSGLLEVTGGLDMGNLAISHIDIRYGAITFDRDIYYQIQNLVASGNIIAFGGSGEVIYDYNETNSGKTTITANGGNPPTPDPAQFSIVPKSVSKSTIVMTATEGYDDDGPVEYYFAEISGSPGASDSGWITSNKYTDYDLSAGTEYIYTVTMRDIYGNQTIPSDPVTVSTWAENTSTITWNPAANGIYPPSAGSWSNALNWSPGYAGRPDGNFKCQFDYNGAAECSVIGEHIFDQLVMNVNGSGSVVRILDGGSISTTGGWAGIGYNHRTNHMIVETGGQASFDDHLWIGLFSPGIGILDIDGGTVNVSGQLGLGWDSGTGYVNITNGGILNLNTLDGSRAIRGDSVLDIETGKMIINGDRTSIICDYVANGKITAYGGTGRVLYDYNASFPGKTTVRAIEGVEGDLDGDYDVDVDDIAVFVGDWLTTECSNPANFNSYCRIDLLDFAVLAQNWLGGVRTQWHIAETVLPTEEYLITPHWAEDFGIVDDGVTDVTDAIQSALISISNLGGGSLYIPAGIYKVSGNLTVPSRVTIRGDWQKPVPGSPIVGTILQAYAGRGDVNAAPFIELSESSGLKGIAIWYPEQSPTDIQPYPPCVHGGGVTLENVTFVNPYFGFTTYFDGTTACPFVRNVYGTPLYIGTEYDRLADIGRIESVHFSPDFWAGSGLPGSPTAGEHEDWMYDNGTGMIVRRIDWSYSCYVTIEGYSIGLAMRPSRWSEDSGSTPNGQSYGFDILNCKTGIYVEKSAYAGYQCTRFNILNAETGIYLSSTATEVDMFHTCTIDASGDAVYSDGSARVMMMSCDIQRGTIDINNGYLSIINSDFAASSSNHIEIAGGCHGAAILGNRFADSTKIVEYTSYPVNIDHTQMPVDPLPAYDYKKPEKLYKPANDSLFVVTRYPYNAKADGITDDATAFQAALIDAYNKGGGTVFVPGGNYRLNSNLVIPTGVELRGVLDVAHDTRVKGSLINVCAGRNIANGTPFIQIAPNAGIKGLTFHYPEQVYDENDTVNYGMVPYPYLIRGLGADIYVLNIAATIPYEILDLATYRCDRHYVDYIKSTALKTGIHVGGGSTDGQIHNCQFNPSLYTHQGSYYDTIPYNTADGIHQILWRDSTPYLFGNMNGEIIHENFVFGGARGMHLVNENGFGPSGYCLGMGVDQCTNAFQIDDIGDGGLDVINSQIVTVNAASGHYLETGPNLDDTFRMFCSAGWGTHQHSAVINGGDIKLQLFHLARDAEEGAFVVRNNASVQSFGGTIKNYLYADFLTIAPTASAAFVGNVINTSASNMPVNSTNVTSIGNIREQ